MYTSILSSCLLDLFVSMGLVVGGSVCGGLAALITHHNPGSTMLALADQLKIWALVAALGGSMDMLREIHEGIFSINFHPIARQFVYLTAAFVGCQIGYMIIVWLVGSDT